MQCHEADFAVVAVVVVVGGGGGGAVATANLAVALTDAPVGNTVGGPAEAAVVWPSLAVAAVAAWPTV